MTSPRHWFSRMKRGKGRRSAQPANMTSGVRHRESSAVVSQLSAQLGMLGNCGTSSGFIHLRRRFVNISNLGSMPSDRSRLPIITKTMPGKLSRSLVKSRAPVRTEILGKAFPGFRHVVERLRLAASQREIALRDAKKGGHRAAGGLLAVLAIAVNDEGRIRTELKL